MVALSYNPLIANAIFACIFFVLNSPSLQDEEVRAPMSAVQASLDRAGALNGGS